MRKLLLFFTLWVGVTALFCGVLLIYKPDGSLLNLSPALLQHSPFRSYLVPGILLALIVGGTNMIALLFAAEMHPKAYRYTILGGLLLLALIIGQMTLFYYYHWLQLVYLAVGFIIILLSYHLMGKAAF